MKSSPILRFCRVYFGILSTHRTRIGRIERSIRALLLLPPFTLLITWLYIRQRLRGPVTVEGITKAGIRIQCQLPDLIQTYIYLFGTWEPNLTAFLRHRLRSGDTFIDVGANVGYVTSIASASVGPNGTVVAIEPAPPTIAALKDTLVKNGLGNTRIVPCAVSDHEHSLPLFFGPAHNTGHTATTTLRGLQEKGQVRAAPLSALVTHEELASARLIKIDVEGGEVGVLAGLRNSLDKLASYTEIIVEISPQWWVDPKLRPIDVLSPFIEHGFHVYLIPNNSMPWRHLWPNDVDAPSRLRDLSLLERRVAQIDIVLSRSDADLL
ncbi:MULTISPECIES: FkbM family methyltransferase [unclassified Mycobacteroides]